MLFVQLLIIILIPKYKLLVDYSLYKINIGMLSYNLT